MNGGGRTRVPPCDVKPRAESIHDGACRGATGQGSPERRQRAAPRRGDLFEERNPGGGAPQRPAAKRSEADRTRGSPVEQAPTSAVAASTNPHCEAGNARGGRRGGAGSKRYPEPRAARPLASTHARVLTSPPVSARLGLGLGLSETRAWARPQRDSGSDSERTEASNSENICFRMGGWWWALRPLGLGRSQRREGPMSSGWRPTWAFRRSKARR